MDRNPNKGSEGQKMGRVEASQTWAVYFQRYFCFSESVCSSGSRTCSSCYPNQGSDYVLITLNISQWSLIIQNNVMVLVPRFPRRTAYHPLGVI